MLEAFGHLNVEQALALRIVRQQTVPHEFWLWSNGNMKASVERVASWISPNVTARIREILEPNLADANARERQQTLGADAWISGILGYVTSLGKELKLTFHQRMLAASILPLYRSLGTGKLNEALDQTRLRLAETLALLAMAQHLESDFIELIDHPDGQIKFPHLVLKTSLHLELKSISWLCRQATRYFDSLTGSFSEDMLEHLNGRNAGDASRLDCVWSEPSLLWQISGELQTEKADLVLPRQWVDTPLPWTKISDHWNSLALALANPAQAKSHCVINNKCDLQLTLPLGNRGSVTAALLTATIVQDVDDQVVNKIVDDLVALQSDFVEVIDHEFMSDSEVAKAAMGPSHTAHDLEFVGHKLTSASNKIDTEDNSEAGHSKIVLAEIGSNSDPLFISVLRRQIATARNDERTVCLIALQVVAADNLEQEEISSCTETGVPIWQLKVVNCLAVYPEFHESHAFVTVAGELIVCTLDIERSDATNLVREGLEKVLNNKNKSEIEQHFGLARVATPIRYYSGIGSVSSPTAGFLAEQLISATWRCLSASQCLGKSAIKSIEVY